MFERGKDKSDKGAMDSFDTGSEQSPGDWKSTSSAPSPNPDRADVAVIGVPNEDWGEEVKAVVQLVDPEAAADALALMDAYRWLERVAHHTWRAVHHLRQLTHDLPPVGAPEPVEPD